MAPHYDLDKIKFATDSPTWERAVRLYESGKVTEFRDTGFTFTAVVLGTHPYRVIVSPRHYDHATCTCYLGQNDTFCKHMAAVAIHAVVGGKKLTDEEKRQVTKPVCSGRVGTFTDQEFAEVKLAISAAMRHIKPYDGPSRIWFAYQNSLMEGCNRLAAIVSELPVSEQTAGLLVSLLLRLDKKLTTGGVDDSDGTIGTFIEETVEALKQFAALDPACVKTFDKLKGQETCSGWEESLLAMIQRKIS